MQKDERYQLLIAIHDKAGSLLCALGIYDAPHLNSLCSGRGAGRHDLVLIYLLVCHNTDGIATNTSIATQNSPAEIRLVFVELAAIHNARDNLSHVISVACTRRWVQQAVDVFHRKLRCITSRVIFFVTVSTCRAGSGLMSAELVDKRTHPRETVEVIWLFEIDRARDLSVHGCST